jgi:hypothetical protein
MSVVSRVPSLRLWWAGMCVTLLTATQPLVPGADAQTYTPYAVFLAMPPEALVDLQVKLTYLGDWNVRSLVIYYDLASPHVDVFRPYRRAAQETYYLSDDNVPLRQVGATLPELATLISDVGGLPNVTDGDVDPGGIVSFSLYNVTGGVAKAFEAILSLGNATALLNTLQNALEGNGYAARALGEFGCDIDIVSGPGPVEVTDIVDVQLSGLRRVPSTGQYVGTARLTNNGTHTVASPLSLVLYIRPPDVELLNADGKTCRIEPVGMDYIDFVVIGGLAPAQSVSREVRFYNPRLEPIEVEWLDDETDAPYVQRAPRVFAGPGNR